MTKGTLLEKLISHIGPEAPLCDPLQLSSLTKYLSPVCKIHTLKITVQAKQGRTSNDA